MSEFKVIESQEQLDSIIQERIARAKDSVRKEFEGYVKPDDLSGQLADKDKEIETLTATINTLNEEKAAFDSTLAEKDKTIKQYETDSAKTKVAHKMGLSFDAIKFLQGDDEESITKSAEALSTLVKASNPQPLANTEQPVGDSKEASYKKMLNSIRGE